MRFPSRFDRKVTLCVVAGLVSTTAASAQTPPWMNRSLAPDKRAALLVGAMTQDDKYE